jgi:hypothetical protein
LLDDLLLLGAEEGRQLVIELRLLLGHICHEG